MRLITYRHGDHTGVGVMTDESHFQPLETLASLRELIGLGDDGLALARRAAEAEGPTTALDGIELLPVIPDPHVIWCVGVNYRAHREETGRDPSDYPTLFLRIGASQVGHGTPIVRPEVSDKFDYEGELAVIIGKGGRHIPKEDALGHVAGYSCYMDGTIRDWQRDTSQFGPGKNFHHTGAFGPWMVTPDEMGNPYEQTLATRVNGEELQRTTISDMLFDIETLIHYLSTVYPLRPGDVISTGTPGGVGSRRKPPVWLKPGDQVEVEVSGVGVLANRVVQEGEE